MSAGERGVFDPLSLKLAAGVTLMVAFAVIPAIYLATNHHYETQVELTRKQIRREGELLQLTLEHQMLHNDRSLIAEIVKSYGGENKVERVMLFDHLGRLRYSSDPAMAKETFDRNSSPACKVCHERPANQRTSSALVDLPGGQFIRHVVPVKNRPPCYRCHDSKRAINGVLIADSSVEDMKARVGSDVRRLTFGAGAVALALLAGIYLIVRRLLLRPLGQLATTTRQIAAGDFSVRAEAKGTSPLAQLGREFNHMADSVASLIGLLAQQRAQVENVMNGVSDGLLVLDSTLTVIAVNHSLAARLGVRREDLLLRRCHTIWGSADSECPSEAIGGCEGCPGARCFATGTLQTGLRVGRDPITGAERRDEVFASPILDAAGRVTQVAEVWRDITERQSHEARIAEVQRFASLGMLASGFSHEINTPLGTMLICAEDLRRTVRGTGEMPEAEHALSQIDVIRAEISRCQKITRQFLRISRGGDSPKSDVLDLRQTIQAVLPLAEPAARKLGVSLRFVEPDELPAVLANDGTVQQVILNLIVNATQVSKNGGEVVVTCVADSKVRVRVTDRGPGIAPEVRRRIFEPFFSATPGGTGLGLFVSLNLTRQWGGEINVSTEVGKGSTFEVTFPRSDEAT